MCVHVSIFLPTNLPTYAWVHVNDPPHISTLLQLCDYFGLVGTKPKRINTGEFALRGATEGDADASANSRHPCLGVVPTTSAQGLHSFRYDMSIYELYKTVDAGV